MILHLVYLIFLMNIGVNVPEKLVVHDFHLSRCDINYSAEEQSLQIAVSVFLDDLELTLARLGKTDLAFCTVDESPEAEDELFEYLKSHLLIEVDGQVMQLQWVGKEASEDLAAVWSYLEITNISPRQNIIVTNDILLDSFDDQQNMTKVVMDRKRKSHFLFDKSDFTGELKL